VAAQRALADDDTAFVGTDPDRTIPGDDGPMPGSGALLEAVRATTGREPTVVGKPSPHAAAAVADHLDVAPEECLLVGDRLDTDVRLGTDAGMTTALVLSGVTDRDAAARADPDPDHVLDSVADLPALLDAVSGRTRS
jgi:4-nitrophenyl phosphatase